MRNLVIPFKTEKNKQENAPIFLYEIYDYDGQGHDLPFAEYPTNITFNGIEYIAFPITFETISEQTGAAIDEIKIILANISRLIQSYLEQYDFRGKKVRILQIFYATKDDPTAYVDYVFYIDRYDADRNNVTFYLSSKTNVRGVKIPLRTVLRNRCQWDFKSPECGYNNGVSECNRQLQTCKTLGNSKRYGAFPSAGGRRMWV